MRTLIFNIINENSFNISLLGSFKLAFLFLFFIRLSGWDFLSKTAVYNLLKKLFIDATTTGLNCYLVISHFCHNLKKLCSIYNSYKHVYMTPLVRQLSTFRASICGTFDPHNLRWIKTGITLNPSFWIRSDMWSRAYLVSTFRILFSLYGTFILMCVLYLCFCLV